MTIEAPGNLCDTVNMHPRPWKPCIEQVDLDIELEDENLNIGDFGVFELADNNIAPTDKLHLPMIHKPLQCPDDVSACV